MWCHLVGGLRPARRFRLARSPPLPRLPSVRASACASCNWDEPSWPLAPEVVAPAASTRTEASAGALSEESWASDPGQLQSLPPPTRLLTWLSRLQND